MLESDSFVLSQDDWENIIQNLQDSAGIIAQWIFDKDFGGDGQKAAESYLCHIGFACAAIDFVKNNAAECIRFTPMNSSMEG